MSKRIFGTWGIRTALVFRLIVVIGAVLLSMALIGWIDDQQVQAGHEPTALAAVPVERVIRTTTRLTAATRVPTATPSPLLPTPVLFLSSPITVSSTSVPAEATPALAIVAVDDDGRVNVRSGPSTDYARVGLLEPGTQAQVIGRHGDWWQIVYSGAPAWIASWVVTAANTADVPDVEVLSIPPSTETAPSPAPILPPAGPEEVAEERWIDVDLTQQLLTAYEGRTPVYTTLVSTGLPQTPTPVGQFRIWIKFRYDDMEGPEYYLADVPYVMYFYKGYGLHGAYWHANFGQPMSHGCVNLPIMEAEWLFNWANVGTLVNVHS